MQKWLEKSAGDRPAAEDTSLIQSVTEAALPNNRIVVKDNNRIRIIPLHDILYFEAADDYVKIHTADAWHLKNRTMQYFEKILDSKQFVRTHRSYIVNVQLITRLEPHEKESYLAILNKGQRIPVSKAGYIKLKQVLGL
jgi:two-component system LytT family response regulator